VEGTINQKKKGEGSKFCNPLLTGVEEEIGTRGLHTEGKRKRKRCPQIFLYPTKRIKTF